MVASGGGAGGRPRGAPEDFAALLRHGEVLRRLGRADEALEVHRRASVLHPRSVAILYQLAEDYEVRGEVEVAQEIENRILREFPGYGLQVLKRRRDAALAARRWRRAAELQRIEDHFIERDDPRGAISTLRLLIAEAEDDLLPRFFLGRLYHRLEMHDEALKVLDGLEDRLGSSAAYQYLLGRIFERRGEPARALEAYAACARRSGLPEAECRCRVCRLRSGEWQDRCDACGSWTSVELDLGEAGVPPEGAAPLRPEPVWAAAGGWDPAELEESQGAS